MLDAILSFIPAHEAQLLTLFGACTTFLSLLFGFWKQTIWLSKALGSVSPADLIRIWKYLRMALVWFVRWRAAGKAINGVLFIGMLLAVSGCAGTFNEAKLAGAKARTAAPPASASSPERCQSLSERQYWFTGTGLGLVAVGAAAASMALPVQSKTLDVILIAGGTATTVTGGGLTWFGTAAGLNYVREGCHQ
jgi:hypothetical protein